MDIHTIRHKMAQASRIYQADNRDLLGDHTHNDHLAIPRDLIPAAVLIACLYRHEALHIVLTKRSASLAKHPGQISFPGGRIDPDDSSAAAAAVREAWEEIGLLPTQTTLLGQLPDYITRTGYRISPFVAHITQTDNWVLQQQEVAEIFDIPLSVILDPVNPKIKIRYIDGKNYQTFVFPYQNYYIWGATAGILYQFRQVLSTFPSPPLLA